MIYICLNFSHDDRDFTVLPQICFPKLSGTFKTSVFQIIHILNIIDLQLSLGVLIMSSDYGVHVENFSSLT